MCVKINGQFQVIKHIIWYFSCTVIPFPLSGCKMFVNMRKIRQVSILKQKPQKA